MKDRDKQKTLADNYEFIGQEESENFIQEMLLHTREELVEIAAVSMRSMLNGGAWTWATMASHAVDALIAYGALKVRGE